MDTTNLRQIEGGTVIKQADRSSVLAFILQDAKGREKKLDGQTAQVALYTNQGKFWETSTTVKGAEVSFSLPGNLAVDDYLLDISVAGYVFPSDRDLIVRVTQGFKNLPDKETAERAKQTLEEITSDVQKKADENLKQNITIITKKKDAFTSYVDTKATEISTTGDKYLKDIEATTSQNISDIKQVSKTEADKIKTSSTEAISLIGSKKDQALKEIDWQIKSTSTKYLGELENKSKEGISELENRKNEISQGLEATRKTFESNIDTSLNQAIKAIPYEKLKGDKGDRGEKGEAPLVFSTNPPHDTKALWVKHDNVRNIYRNIYTAGIPVAYVGEISKIEGLDGVNSNMNIALNLNTPINEKVDVLCVLDYKFNVIKSQNAIEYIYLQISEKDMATLKTLVEIKKEATPQGESNYFYGMNPETNEKYVSLLRKTGEEKYLTLNVYNVLTNKWEKID